MAVVTPLEDGVIVTASGAVARRDRSYAYDKVRYVLRFAPTPVLSAKVALTAPPDSEPPQSAVAEADLDVGGRPVGVKVAASGMHEAIDRLEVGLRRRLEHLAGRAPA